MTVVLENVGNVGGIAWRLRNGFIQVYYPEREKLWKVEIYKDGRLIKRFVLLWGRTGWLDAINLNYLSDLARKYGSGRYCVVIRKHTGERVTICTKIRVKGIPRKTVRYLPVIQKRPTIVHRRKPARLTTQPRLGFAYLYIFKDGKPIKKVRIDSVTASVYMRFFKIPDVVSTFKDVYRKRYGPGTYVFQLLYGGKKITLARFTVGKEITKKVKHEPLYYAQSIILPKSVKPKPTVKKVERKIKLTKPKTTKPSILVMPLKRELIPRKVEKEYVLIPIPTTQTTIGVKRDYLPWIALGSGALFLLLTTLLLKK